MIERMKLLVTAIIVFFSTINNFSLAETNKEFIGRFVYKTGEVDKTEFRDPLGYVYNSNFSPKATYRQVIDRLLAQAGYSLSKSENEPVWLDRRIAPIHRKLGQVSIKKAIKIFAGKGYEIRVNEKTKTVDLEWVG